VTDATVTQASPTARWARSATATSIGGPGTVLADAEVASFVRDGLAAAGLDGTRVCVLVPDRTRSCPLPLVLEAVDGTLAGRADHVTVVVALGTHAPLADADLPGHTGLRPRDGLELRNHAWWDDATFATVGRIGADRVAELSGGRLREAVDVRVNRAVVDADVTLVVGPVLPHEVVGFSGGNKYLFPGVSGPEMIDLSHWLGALITSPGIIGSTGVTPVRALIDEAAALVPTRRLALCVVTEPGGDRLHAVTLGEPEPAWAAAAEVAAATHVTLVDRPVRRVLSIVPERYGDLWTGAKGFYKVEPVVAHGGQVVLYAPHITEVAPGHPTVSQVGYHCREYFTGQWDRFHHLPRGDLAHSTHLRGAGTWDPVGGERCRVTVTLATGIPADVVRAVGLDPLDPATVDVAAWAGDPDTLVVPDAGERLFRLRP
jgi:nickel-dependent lactate racemase